MTKSIIKYMAAALLMATVTTSCDSFFDLKPTNRLVIDDYWKSEDDVLAVTASVYNQLCSSGCMERLLLWSEFRSDNCLLGTADNTDISSFANLSLSPTNGYTSWSDFYKAINYCNTVEAYAPRVCEVSPTFTRAQLDAYIAEVRGLRAWCYFNLIRTFRDVPFILTPTIDDEVEFEVEQSDPDYIVDYLIDDLKEYENRSQVSFTSVLYNHGRMTQAAIRSLIADMLLWRGRYSECIQYCDMIINDTANPFSLVQGSNFNNIFFSGNSRESIFELQFSTTTQSNSALNRMYGNTTSGGNEYFMANDMASLLTTNDVRLYNSMEYRSAGDATRHITKYAAVVSNAFNNSERRYSFSDMSSSGWIVYRLADIYLMKAEALAESNGSLDEIYELCCKTYDRANYNLDPQTLAKPTSHSDALQMVIDERHREFMFEGKRYFDLLRQIKNHPEQFSTIVTNILKPRYIKENVDNQTINAKLISIDALYMPINHNELRQNTKLKQNPFYQTSSNIEKN